MKKMLRFAMMFKLVEFEKGDQVFDRNLMLKPFIENETYVQIGLWNLEEPVVIKAHSSAPEIYFCPTEDASPERPILLANSINAYILKAYTCYIDFKRENEVAVKTNK